MKNHHTLTTLSIKNRPQQNTIYLSPRQLKISRVITLLQRKKGGCHWQRDSKSGCCNFFFYDKHEKDNFIRKLNKFKEEARIDNDGQQIVQ